MMTPSRSRAAPLRTFIDRGVASRRLASTLLVMVLASTLAAWLIVREWSHDSGPAARLTIFERPCEGDCSVAVATAEGLLQIAEDELRSIREKYPASPGAWSALARRDYAISDTRGAAAAWRKSVELDPLFTEGLFGLGLLAFEENRFDDAVALYEDVSRLTPGDPRVPVTLAESFLHNGQEQHATLVLEQHLATEQASVQAWEMLGKAHLQARKYAKAISAFERALKYAPASKDALFGLAQAYRALGQPEKSAEFNEQFQALAKLAQKASKQDAAAFEDAKYAAHVASQACVDAARVAIEAGDDRDAERLLLRAAKLEPQAIDPLNELQRLVQIQGRKRDAIDVGQRLVELVPANVDHWLNLGTLYSELESPDQAVAAFKRAIALAPDDERCQRAKKIIGQLE